MISAGAAALLLAGSLLSAGAGQAAQNPSDTTTYNSTPTPKVQPLDCRGTTGGYGCGPGFFWNGNRCVPC
jgi:hypothetical protein